ncbi:MAG: lytic transglycosylase domain-containing protein [Actinomycetia bacterium]|nr:lytic transglycosylase domain-containing protein [Actinomycetes bacterium]
MKKTQKVFATVTAAVVLAAGAAGAVGIGAASAAVEPAQLQATQAKFKIQLPGPEFGSVAHSQAFAQRYMAENYGWGAGEFDALVQLWNNESGWNHKLANPSSGAYGIPQSLPGSKMSATGRDWQTNPETQIKWGLQYIQSTYGTPSGALSHFNSNNWY